MPDSQHDRRQKLFQRSREGDRQALGELLDLHRDYLRLLARVHIDRSLQAKADPSDLVQESCLQAHRDFHQFRGTTEVEFLQWLRQIMATKGVKMVRRYGTLRRDVQLEQSLEAELDAVSRALGRTLGAGQSSPGETLIREEQIVAVCSALFELPEAYREVIVMHQLQGITLREIAARMGRSEGAVQKLWARGVVQLRKIMKE